MTRRRRLLPGAIALALLTLWLVVPAQAHHKPDHPRPHPIRTTTTAVPPTTAVPTTTTVTTTVPTTSTTTTLPPTTVAPTTTTTGGLVFTDTLVLPADGDWPTIWGGFGTAPRCPAGTALDFAASTITAPADVIVHYFPQLLDSITLQMPAEYDPVTDDWTTRTISYRIVCVPA